MLHEEPTQPNLIAQKASSAPRRPLLQRAEVPASHSLGRWVLAGVVAFLLCFGAGRELTLLLAQSHGPLTAPTSGPSRPTAPTHLPTSIPSVTQPEATVTARPTATQGNGD